LSLIGLAIAFTIALPFLVAQVNRPTSPGCAEDAPEAQWGLFIYFLFFVTAPWL